MGYGGVHLRGDSIPGSSLYVAFPYRASIYVVIGSLGVFSTWCLTSLYVVLRSPGDYVYVVFPCGACVYVVICTLGVALRGASPCGACVYVVPPSSDVWLYMVLDTVSLCRLGFTWGHGCEHLRGV